MSMKESSMRTKSLNGLGDLWKQKYADSEPNTFKSNLQQVANTEAIKPKKILKEKASTFEEPEINVIFHPNFKSIRNKEHSFCNFLNTKKCFKEEVALKKIFENENKTCHPDALPFTFEQETLRIEDRHRDILDDADLYNNESYGEISKGTYLDEASKLDYSTAKRGQSIRVYFKHEGNNVEILLIDLYHMFATSLMDEVIRKYSDVSGYNICMNTLRTFKRA